MYYRVRKGQLNHQGYLISFTHAKIANSHKERKTHRVPERYQGYLVLFTQAKTFSKDNLLGKSGR